MVYSADLSLKRLYKSETFASKINSMASKKQNSGNNSDEKKPERKITRIEIDALKSIIRKQLPNPELESQEDPDSTNDSLKDKGTEES